MQPAFAQALGYDIFDQRTEDVRGELEHGLAHLS